MKNYNLNVNALMKFSPSLDVTSSRPVHELSHNNSGFKRDKNSKNEVSYTCILENKK